MANVYLNLPAPAGNGAGAWVNVSTMGGVKTIVVGGTTRATINIEMSNEAVPTKAAPVCTFYNKGKQTVVNAARWMRANVSGFLGGGAPDVEVGADDAGASFVTLAATAGDGVGLSVNTAGLGNFKTVTVGGPFRGSLIIEVSEDNVQWGQCFVFTQPGQQSKIVAAQFMRTRREGVPTNSPGLPLVGVGGVNEVSAATISSPSNCLTFQPGSGQSGPVVFDTWADLMAQLAILRAASNGAGCYTIMFDDSIVSPVVIPAGGPYAMENVLWEGNGTFFGSFVEIANGASFTRLREFSHNLTVRNLNTVTSPCADLADGDVIRISDFTNLETTTPGGVAFFDGTAIPAAGSVFVIMTESSNLGFYISGPVFSMPTAGSFLIILCDDLSTPIAGAPGPFAGAVGAILRLETPSLANQPLSSAAAFPGWLGTFNSPVITASPSFLPKPYLAAPAVAAQVAAFNDWLRIDAIGGPIVQTLPVISTATGFFKHPGCLLLVSEVGHGQDLTIVPAAGDTFTSGVASYQIPAQGSLLLIGDGVSQWSVAAGWPNQRFSPPEAWAQQNVAAGQVDVALSAQVSTNFDDIKMIRRGSIVGLSTRLTEAITPGSDPLTVQVTIDGVGGTLLLVHTSASNATGGQVTQRAGIDVFNPGQRVGIQLTTGAAFAPTTTDLESWLEIEEVP